MAFQLGLQAATASSMLYEQDVAKLGSWSAAIPNMAEAEAISALSVYDTGHHLSLRHRCFVSAVGLKSVTISGAPPALKAFTETLTASQPERRVIELPVFAAFHAIHIHPFLDFPSFLTRCGVSLPLLARFKPVHHLLSPLTGEPVVANDAFGLFKTAVCETLQAQLRLDLVVEGFIKLIRHEEVPSITVEIVSPTTAADGIVSALSQTQAGVSSRPIVSLPSAGELRRNPPFNNAPLAIVGMSGRFPDADSAEALWDLLAQKIDAHRVVPKDRFDVDVHVDPSGKAKNTSWTPYGCFINRPGEFDPRFFNMSPKEALQTDPMQRLALVTAYEALEQAGFVPDRTRSSACHRIGTFYGQTSDDYRDVNSAQDIGTYFITGGIRAFGPVSW
jgi:iron transport multicopper oxidase